ncbi:hypothetical protein NBE98_12110 [Clostridium swellfunianum]|uniref:hypothetical protein n=1 Tax=Clostridium swellfunianum TaxID=1367462 RepID=UPI002030745B|nr:hypothetical protein [Clostridium swellfunianum]MCM0649119.1 hypothetical protein [Clostridium swellfunianum]
MKSFQALTEETLKVENLEELESAADLFQFGVEKGYYTKRQADEFNLTYWKVKNKLLSYEISDDIKWNILDIMSIVSSAPNDIKDRKYELINYVNGRIKALKGKVSGLK